jgi:hypothetical protein
MLQTFLEVVRTGEDEYLKLTGGNGKERKRGQGEWNNKKTPIGLPYWGLCKSAEAVGSGSREISFFDFGPFLGDAHQRTLYFGVRIRLRPANEHRRFLFSYRLFFIFLELKMNLFCV